MSQDNSIIACVHETAYGLSINVKKPSNRYINEILRLNCAPELLELKLFPNAKEITESFGVFRAVQSYAGKDFPLNDPNIVLFSVGEGKRPATSAMFAFRTKWTCYAVDPKIDETHDAFKKVRKLGYIKKYVQHITNLTEAYEKVVIIAQHSHANLIKTVNALRGDKTLVVAIPCCVDLKLEFDPTYSYYDWGIHSPKRNVKIWKLPFEKFTRREDESSK